MVRWQTCGLFLGDMLVLRCNIDAAVWTSRSATALKPLTNKLDTTDHLPAGQYSAGKPKPSTQTSSQTNHTVHDTWYYHKYCSGRTSPASTWPKMPQIQTWLSWMGRVWEGCSLFERLNQDSGGLKVLADGGIFLRFLSEDRKMIWTQEASVTAEKDMNFCLNISFQRANFLLQKQY